MGFSPSIEKPSYVKPIVMLTDGKADIARFGQINTTDQGRLSNL